LCALVKPWNEIYSHNWELADEHLNYQLTNKGGVAFDGWQNDNRISSHKSVEISHIDPEILILKQYAIVPYLTIFGVAVLWRTQEAIIPISKALMYEASHPSVLVDADDQTVWVRIRRFVATAANINIPSEFFRLFGRITKTVSAAENTAFFLYALHKRKEEYVAHVDFPHGSTNHI
jgi:hypothetical protein